MGSASSTEGEHALQRQSPSKPALQPASYSQLRVRVLMELLWKNWPGRQSEAHTAGVSGFRHSTLTLDACT